MAEYKYLFSPLKLGSAVLKNRIVCAAHGNQVADPVTFMVTERAKAYYREKAAGGAAAVIMVSSSVDPRADYFPANNFALWTDDIIPGLKQIVDVCHQHDCKFFVQPSHPGSHQICHVQVDEVPLAPSQVPAIEVPNQVPQALSVEEIHNIQDLFVAAVKRIVAAGVDGIELMAGHEKLPWAFLSPLTNKRTDEYGGSLENRFRFLKEMIEKVAAVVPENYPMGIRLNVMELEPGGLDLNEGVEIVKMVEAIGRIDWLAAVLATYRSIAFELNPFAAQFEPGWGGEFVRRVKSETTLPVSISSKINDPGLADNMIAEGKCDYVYLARPLIADPHFPRKAQEGREDEITPCIYCNQGCVARSFNRASTNGIRCSVNPAAGDEVRWGSWTFEKAAKRKKVAVIGTGPSGLMCAWTAARRGHEVSVFGREDEIGGQARLIKKIPGHNMPQTYLDYLEAMAKKSGVKINLGVTLDDANLDDFLAREKPDAVVLATGARPARDGRGSVTTEPIPGWDMDHVCTYEDILLGRVQPKGKTLIVDELGDRVAPGVAEVLGEQGIPVEIVTRWGQLGPNLHFWLDEPFILGKLDSMGVIVHPNSWPMAITPNGAACMHLFSTRQFTVEADTVVLSTMKYSNIELYDLFKKRGVDCQMIGDARAPRWIWTATHDGYKVGREL